MHCDYCFYCDEAAKRELPSRGMMSMETAEEMIRKVLRQGKDRYTFAFQGGEPTLRGLAFYQKFTDLVDSYNSQGSEISYSLQTNGYTLDEDWCRFFREKNFLVGVSVDGLEETHDACRHTADGKGGTYERIRQSTDLLDRYGVDYNILTVVSGITAPRIREIYQDYRKNGWMYQQYIACLDPLGEKKCGESYSLTPKQYGEFLITLFDLWYKDWKKGRQPSIRMFENWVGVLMGIEPEACEQRGICSAQCVVEADGSVYPCDFYALDSYLLGNFGKDRCRDFISSDTAERFVKESMQISRRCRECVYYQLCRCGCRRNRVPDPEDPEKGAVSCFCESYRMFFAACLDRMTEMSSFFSWKELNPGRIS